MNSSLVGSSAKPQYEMEGRLFLDVVISHRSSVLKLLTGEDKSLLVRRDSFLVLDFCLHSLDRIRGLNLQSDCFPRKCLNENLHPFMKSRSRFKSIRLVT